jgi:hypothetical protein
MKRPNVEQRLMSELILLGGEIMSRREAYDQLLAEGVTRRALDWCVFAAPAITYGEVLCSSRETVLS